MPAYRLPGLPEDEPTASGVLLWVEKRCWLAHPTPRVRRGSQGPYAGCGPEESLGADGARARALGGVLTRDRLFDQREHPGRHEAGGPDN